MGMCRQGAIIHPSYCQCGPVVCKRAAPLTRARTPPQASLAADGAKGWSALLSELQAIQGAGGAS